MPKEYIEANGKKFEIDNGFLQDPIGYCNEFVKEFEKEFEKEFLQDEEIESDLKKFPFGKLYDNEKYGSDGDADRGELVKIIHFLSYSKCLEKNTDLAQRIKLKLKVESPWKWGKHKEKKVHTILFNNIVNDIELNSGDTLNTFATLFSRACESSLDDYFYNGYDKIYMKFEFLDNKELIKFHKEFQCIGNFMLLPYSKDYSINKYRAGWENGAGWYDYCDLFLKSIRVFYEAKGNETNFLNNQKDEEKFLEALESEFKNIQHTDDAYKIYVEIMKAPENNSYFNTFETFREFVDFNSLWAFFDEDEQIKKICLNEEPYFHWMKNINYEEYKKFADNYIKKAEEIIEKRSRNLIDLINEKDKK